MGNRYGVWVGALLWSALLSWLGNGVAGQQKPLLVVGQDSVYEGAFRYAYEKNRSYTLATGLAVDDFFDSYKAFRLKVAEARRLGLDTLGSVRAEYDKYVRFQLTSRLVDSAEREQLYLSTYERMRQEVSASHILIRVDEGGDTVEAYRRAVDLRARLAGGEDFSKMARELSEDPSAQQNGGYLGYFGAFSMVAPFERMAYATPVDSISQPVRTAFGYHLIRVHGRRPARGKMRVAHIMKLRGANASDTARSAMRRSLDSIRALVTNGAEFSSVAMRESQDRGSAQQGGILPWITPERFPADFVEACFALGEDGEVSPVVETPFGLHIIQRLDYQPVPSFEEAREQIRSHFAREGMILEGEYALRNALQRKVKLQLHRDAIGAHCEQSLSGSEVSDSVQQQALADCVGDRLTGREMTAWLREHRRLGALDGQPGYFQALQQAVDEMVEAAAIRSVVADEPELRYMLDEFLDGLLLFEVCDRKLWNQPMPDSVALRAVYKRHRKSLRFPVCYEVECYTSISDTVLHQLRRLLVRGARIPADGFSLGIVRGAACAARRRMRSWQGEVRCQEVGQVLYHQ